MVQLFILVAAIARFIFNYRMKHPLRNGVAIDYTTASILLPSIVAGSTCGVIFHTVFPDLVETMMLVTLLSFAALKCWFKGRKLWQLETLLKLSPLEQKESLLAEEECVEGIMCIAGVGGMNETENSNPEVT